MLLNWIYEHDAAERKRNGEVVHDQYERYQVLKNMEPEIDAQYERGEIDQKRYESYKKTLADAENRMRG